MSTCCDACIMMVTTLVRAPQGHDYLCLHISTQLNLCTWHGEPTIDYNPVQYGVTSSQAVYQLVLSGQMGFMQALSSLEINAVDTVHSMGLQPCLLSSGAEVEIQHFQNT